MKASLGNMVIVAFVLMGFADWGEARPFLALVIALWSLAQVPTKQ